MGDFEKIALCVIAWVAVVTIGLMIFALLGWS
jgi:hypothetical protein